MLVLAQQVGDVLNGSLSKSYLREQSRMLQRFKEFADNFREMDVTTALLMFIQDQRVSITEATAARYLTVTAAALGAIGTKVDSTLVAEYRKGLCNAARDEEVHALPLMQREFHTLLQLYPEWSHLFQTMRCGAMRVDDVCDLTKERMRRTTSGILVILDGITKSTRTAPNQRCRADHYVLVPSTPELLNWFDRATERQSIRDNGSHVVTPTAIANFLASVPPPTKLENRELKHTRAKYTKHSIKQGAVTDFARILISRDVPPETAGLLLARFARHKDTRQAVPQNTVMYLADKLLIAQLNGLHQYVEALL